MADAKVPITDAMVDRYLGYNKDFRQAQIDWVRQSHGNLADLRADSAFGAAGAPLSRYAGRP